VISATNSYDAVPYPGFAYPNMHPDSLAAMAILHGLFPAPVDHCRVLEVACGEGANLIPMAYAIPGSEFIGFDMARQPIERGQVRIRQLGLTNVRIFQGDLLKVGNELGMFDYLIAHGLYSWAPVPVRDRLLGLCRELLAPEGIAVISYNALPGGYARQIAREVMLAGVGSIKDVGEKVETGIRFLRDVLETRPQNDPFRSLLEEHVNSMKKRSPEAVFHDELSEVNAPVLFSDFVEHARTHNLQYLSEVVLPPPPDPWYRADLRTAIEAVGDGGVIAQEQVLDFMRMRKYRETLLCHSEREVQRSFSGDAFSRLFFASPAVPEPCEAGTSRSFVLPEGIRMETAHAGTIALMDQLTAAWPRALSWSEIEPMVPAEFSLDGSGIAILTRLAISRMIDLHAWRAPVAAKLSAMPRASASALRDARGGMRATTLLHTTVLLDDPVVRSLLLHLDGTRDRAALFDALKVEFPDMPQDELEQGIEPNLQMFYRAGMLEA
jgi:methyltransferase-like protein/protein-L-isoaspartate O-methyltransferase